MRGCPRLGRGSGPPDSALGLRVHGWPGAQGRRPSQLSWIRPDRREEGPSPARRVLRLPRGFLLPFRPGRLTGRPPVPAGLCPARTSLRLPLLSEDLLSPEPAASLQKRTLSRKPTRGSEPSFPVDARGRAWGSGVGTWPGDPALGASRARTASGRPANCRSPQCLPVVLKWFLPVERVVFPKRAWPQVGARGRRYCYGSGEASIRNSGAGREGSLATHFSARSTPGLLVAAHEPLPAPPRVGGSPPPFSTRPTMDCSHVPAPLTSGASEP